MRRRRWHWAWPLVLLWVSGMAMAAGSWMDRAPPVRVSLVDGQTRSAPLKSAGQASSGQAIGDVHWRFQWPPGSAVTARLCHPGGCVSLPNQRGTTRALAGLAADSPLRFHFALRQGQSPLTVKGLQVIVNYR